MALNMMQNQRSRNDPEYYHGQWTKEEQDYVTCLVDGFKLGSLDIPDGTSLRFFISAKLGCKPKRVSKKYERSGYNGKQVYRRDSNLPAAELEEYRERLKDCETKFKDSRALVVSMQESKTESKPTSPRVHETPVITLSPNSNVSALEVRLAAMRNQIDRTATMLTMGQSAATVHAPMQHFPNNPFLGHGIPRASSLEVQQALFLQRQRAAMANGFSTGLPFSTGFGGASPLHYSDAASVSNGPANKLLVDLYRRRQQLMLGAAAMASPAMPTALYPFVDHDHKRTLEELEVEEQSRKRARAA